MDCFRINNQLTLEKRESLRFFVLWRLRLLNSVKMYCALGAIALQSIGLCHDRTSADSIQSFAKRHDASHNNQQHTKDGEAIRYFREEDDSPQNSKTDIGEIERSDYRRGSILVGDRRADTPDQDG